MNHQIPNPGASSAAPFPVARPAGVLPRLLPLFALQPILARIIARVAALHPGMFARLGPYQQASYLIDPINLPFVLHLRPDPNAPLFRACRRTQIPPHDAAIAGRFLDLFALMDCAQDGDALFFSRGLTITGSTEAVVCLRNALDDVEGSVAGDVADMFGPPGRAILGAMRRQSAHNHEG